MKQEKRFFLSVWWIVFPPPPSNSVFFSACRVVGFLYTVNLGTYTHEKKTSNTRTNKSSRRIRNDRSKTTEHWFSMPDRGTQIYACLCFACWVVLSGFDLYSIARNKASPIQKKNITPPPPSKPHKPKNTSTHTHTQNLCRPNSSIFPNNSFTFPKWPQNDENLYSSPLRKKMPCFVRNFLLQCFSIHFNRYLLTKFTLFFFPHSPNDPFLMFF